MKILVTGSSGFIGYNVTERLLDKGHTVFAPVRHESLDKVKDLHRFQDFKVLKGNFFDSDVINQLAEIPEFILHFASIRGAGKDKEKNYYNVNVEGTRTLLNFAYRNNIKKIIYCSSVGVLGTIPKKLPAKPDDTPKPDGYYHKTKLESEKIVLARNNKDFKTCVLRPSITYGPRDDGFVPKLIEMIRNSKFVLPASSVKIHLLSVKTFCDLIEILLKVDVWPGKTYHVADREPLFLKDLVNEIRLLLGKDLKVYRAPGFLFQLGAFLFGLAGLQGLKTSIELISKNWYYDIQKTISELNYKPSDTLMEIKGVIDAK